MQVLGTILNMPKNTSRLGKNGMKITTISALIYESKLALQGDLNFYSQIPNSCPVELPKKSRSPQQPTRLFFWISSKISKIIKNIHFRYQKFCIFLRFRFWTISNSTFLISTRPDQKKCRAHLPKTDSCSGFESSEILIQGMFGWSNQNKI